MTMNVARGWPADSALQDNFPPKDGENIIEGMAIKLDNNNEWIKADGSPKEVAWFALDSQDAKDVIGSKRLPAILGNCIVETDQFVTAAYTPGMELQVSTTVGQEGLVMPHAGGTAPTYGWVVRVSVEYDGTTMLQFAKPVPFGTAQ